MKQLSILLLGIFLLTSCEITEKVYIDKQGNVSYSSNMDLTQMMEMVPKDELKENDYPIDSIFTVDGITKSQTEFSKGFEGDEEKELMKNFKIHVKLDDDESFMNMILDKKNLNDFNSFMSNLSSDIERINTKRLKQNEKLPDSAQLDLIDIPIFSMPKLSYNKKSFKRTGPIKSITESSNNEQMKGMEGLKDMVRFKLEYHFERPIKSVSDKSARLSPDGKTVYIEKPMSIAVEDPKAFDFEVKFK
ncbi:hypothetical protein NMK71_06115 [Weeksellaceae bacterium KMM 9713]|uniref:Lipoprotein n=1 Tax=Profundicola chukchiensis TaxID=2961959 RepID=A0A9X4MYM1_9FLAO|nr:hypothetical protein [Profundicola chukchiensis]MDG4945982.1 hypothetical protein [Profundicola chukchiensis]